MKVPTLETARLILRQFSPKEARILFDMAKDKELVFGDMPYPYPMEMARRWITVSSERADMYYFAIEEKASRAIIGSIWISAVKKDNSVDDGCLSYGLLTQARGKGYATEAGKAILDFAFQDLKLEKLRAETKTDNLGSHKVLKKLGFSVIEKMSEFQKNRFSGEIEGRWFWEIKNHNKAGYKKM
jgi:RimJ/RimL family protein N-acetyltransferase